MANTFELISSVTVGGAGAASASFSSIPSTFTDLCLKFSVRTTEPNPTDYLLITFNGNSSNYSGKYLIGTGSGTPSSGSVATRYFAGAEGNTSTASTFSNNEVYIPNAFGSSYKSYSTDFTSENNATFVEQGFVAGLWSDNSAINSISIASGNSKDFVQYSTFYLYGVRNA